MSNTIVAQAFGDAAKRQADTWALAPKVGSVRKAVIGVKRSE
ncbi:hypothetical protein [Boseongicola aestuarii]|nr:hypothetical protein [Boseongicola aestuarii]